MVGIISQLNLYFVINAALCLEPIFATEDIEQLILRAKIEARGALGVFRDEPIIACLLGALDTTFCAIVPDAALGNLPFFSDFFGFQIFHNLIIPLIAAKIKRGVEKWQVFAGGGCKGYTIHYSNMANTDYRKTVFW